MGRVKTIQASLGTSAGSVTSIDGTATAKIADYTVTDTDRIRTLLVTTGSTSFNFLDADVSVANDTITETAHGYSNGKTCFLSSTAALPTGVQGGLVYYFVNVAANTFELDTAPSGSGNNITAASSGGTHTVNLCTAITLPTAADNNGRMITVKKVDTGTGWVVIQGEGSETIDGRVNLTLAGQYDEVTVQSDGTNWYAVSYMESRTHSTVFTFNGSGGSSSAVTMRVTRVGRIVTVVMPVWSATTGTSSDRASSSALATQFRPPVNCNVALPVNLGGSLSTTSGTFRMVTDGTIDVFRDAAGATYANSSASTGPALANGGAYIVTYSV